MSLLTQAPLDHHRRRRQPAVCFSINLIIHKPLGPATALSPQPFLAQILELCLGVAETVALRLHWRY